VVSIVLFIGVSSFGAMLLKATGMVYEDYGSNVLIQIHGEDKARQDRLAGEISLWDGVEAHPFRRVQNETELAEGQMTATGLEMLGAGMKNLYLYSLSEERLAELCGQLGIAPAAIGDTGKPGAILINATGTYIRAGRRYNFTPYRLSGQELPVSVDDRERVISILGETGEIPREIALEFSANAVNLVVSEAIRASLNQQGISDWLSLTVMVTDADAFEARADEYLAAEMEENTYSVLNYEAAVKNSRNIWLLIMIFVYGFIALLSLIGVTNVVTTISTAMALRRREFAVLRSMGMTQSGIAKSLRYESLIYGVKSILIGVPIGIGASLAMYYALGVSMSFEYIWPVSSILISTAAVLLLTLLTTGFAGYRQRRENIVGSLQNEIT
jgi:putative ABC transport system permease protein